jgi:hypothetical protein
MIQFGQHCCSSLDHQTGHSTCVAVQEWPLPFQIITCLRLMSYLIFFELAFSRYP